jgi:hypothetical protein
MTNQLPVVNIDLSSLSEFSLTNGTLPEETEQIAYIMNATINTYQHQTLQDNPCFMKTDITADYISDLSSDILMAIKTLRIRVSIHLTQSVDFMIQTERAIEYFLKNHIYDDVLDGYVIYKQLLEPKTYIECPACLDCKPKLNSIETKCKHNMCVECFSTMVRKAKQAHKNITCPICRANVDNALDKVYLYTK